MDIIETGALLADGSPKRIAHKCDLCAGVADSPSCVKVCLTDALELVTEESLLDSINQKRRKAITANAI
jgi:electron transport protein HydN